ncbi:MAG: hypothetical protein HYZ53_20395 [Planctomycetes bacterium]|nr:hypothetical protein [Planctomycetota bacterium]
MAEPPRVAAPLAELLRWLAEAPTPLSPGMAAGPPGGRANVRAVVADLYETLVLRTADAAFLRACEISDDGPLERNRQRWILAAAHLLWHPAVRGRSFPDAAVRKLFVQELPALAAVAPADGLLTDAERREELIRRSLRALGLLLPGESAEAAEDRLAQVDSVERHRLVATAAEKEKRARVLREEELRRRAAEEAASKDTRE